MSGGTPVAGGGHMRQRHSQGYTSSSDDLEDDACSRAAFLNSSLPKSRTWVDVLENFLWIASALFIIYYGDRRSNLIFLLWHDDRIRRIPLYMGMLGVSLNVLFFLYTCMVAWGLRKTNENWEVSSIAALPILTLLGLVSFCLFTFALWPIFSFLTLPLVFTLFMSGMVILPYLVIETFKPQPDLLRTD